jgi:hypothetical protein
MPGCFFLSLFRTAGTSGVVESISEFVRWRTPEVHVVELLQKLPSLTKFQQQQQKQGQQAARSGQPSASGNAASTVPCHASTVYEDSELQARREGRGRDGQGEGGKVPGEPE